MFYYEEKKDKYYVWSDKSKGRYGPFEGVYVKNKKLGIVDSSFDYGQYPGYKYSVGIGKEKIFLFSEQGIEKIFNINNKI